MQSIIQFLNYLDDVYNDQELEELNYAWSYFLSAYGNWHKEPYLKQELKRLSPYKITYKKEYNRRFMNIDFERGVE